MRKRQRLAFFAIGGLGLLAAIAPGLAAGINVNTPSSGTPAAGQGAVAVQGFVVEEINWTVSDAGVVTEVTFDIFRTGDCSVVDPNATPLTYNCSSATSTVLDANATVRVSLKTSTSNWASCAVATAGASVCNTTSAAIAANDLTEVEVLAFDSA